jgi:FSR family fosmidomycin resistance protein-like MFS transporter
VSGINSIKSTLVVFGSAHALVDATCAGIIFNMSNIQTISALKFFYLAILYNLLAFGLQPFIGLISDKLQTPRFFTILGCIIIAVSTIVFPVSNSFGICFAGLGNAVFHIGGGSVSLNLTPKRASAPGIFVAPGALGLFIGTIIGKSGYFIGWPFALSLIIFCIMINIISIPKINYDRQGNKVEFNLLRLIVLLLLISIAVRSLVGLSLVFPWKSNMILLVILTLAVVLGKALGGILADRFGWIEVSIIALLISSPLISFGSVNPYFAITGVFLFNMTMPVTLVAISNMFAGRPGFSFGLTCLALIIGAFPTFIGSKNVFNSSWSILVVILLTATILYFGLKLYFKLKYINFMY